MKYDWNIHLVKDDTFPIELCNAHTHGMEKYNHKDFQIVLFMEPDEIADILNYLGEKVKAGKRFKAGDYVDGIYVACSVRLDNAEESGRGVLRVVIPDGLNRFPGEGCSYPFSWQNIETKHIIGKGVAVS